MRGQRHSAIVINQPRNAGAVDSRGDSLTEAHITKPLLFARDLRKTAFNIVVQVEHQEVVFQPRTGVIQLEVAGLLLRLQRGIIISAQTADDPRFAGAKTDYLRILRGYREEDQLVKIWESLPF